MEEAPENKAPAELQITAEQILLEAYERKDAPIKHTQQRLNDLEELKDYQRRKRTEYENALRRNRLDFGQWLRYATFEIEQKDYPRARSIFERCLEVDHGQINVWLRYIQTELKTKNVNHARNVLERAVTLLPRVDKIWYYYVNLEESLKNYLGTRSLFKRWCTWQPSLRVWESFVKFEIRLKEFDNARKIFEQVVVHFPTSMAWLKWISFEKSYGDDSTVRSVFTLSVDSLMSLGVEQLDEKILIEWCNWESNQKEWDRVRALYQFGLSKLPRKQCIALEESYTEFVKQFGDKQGKEEAVLRKRKLQYEDTLDSEPENHSLWWDYLNLVIGYRMEQDLVPIFEKAVSRIPSSLDKDSWHPFIFLWARYLFWDELHSGGDTRVLYKRAIALIPHKKFTFSKMWIWFAEFEIRQNNLVAARKILGQSLGLCSRRKVFRFYIDLEMKLREFDRVRKLYERYLTVFPQEISAWKQFIELEESLGESSRVCALYDIGCHEESVEFSSRVLLWQDYISYKAHDVMRYDEARSLFDELLAVSDYQVGLYIQRCRFELTLPSKGQIDEYKSEAEKNSEGEVEFEFAVSDEAREKCRALYRKAFSHFKALDKEETVTVLNSFKEFEESYGNENSVEKVSALFPTVVRKRKVVDGVEEEFMDFIFPEEQKDEKKSKMSAFLANAQKWKKESGSA